MPLTISRNLLEHSFYKRWLAGTLTQDELRDYAGQYAHVVRALPGWLRRAAEQAGEEAARLERHADEEEDHVRLWERFAAELGVQPAELAAAAPNTATRSLLERTERLSAGRAGVAVAWAVESQSAPVSREKLVGLRAHYGIAGAGAAYFDLHAERDVLHTAELDALIEELDGADLTLAQTIADTVQDGLWDLLTSVERAA